MDKRPIGYQAGKTYALDKKVPKTNKYDHIESKLTGKIGTTAKDVQIISTFPFNNRQQGNRTKEKRTIQENQGHYLVENDKPIKSKRVHLQLGQAR